MLIKQRIAKKSERGIYLQDKELQETRFKPGQHFRYLIDTKKNRIVIIPDDENQDNTVSKRQLKDGVKPVLDLRAEDCRKIATAADYLLVSIYDNKIVIEGYQAESEADSSDQDSVILDEDNKIFTLTLDQKDVEAFIRFPFSLEIIERSLQQICDDISPSVIDHLSITLKLASFFCGAGVMDYAFQSEGFDICVSVERDKDACLTYRHNLGNHIYPGDINKVNFSSFGKADVAIAGSPCQDFSLENQRNRYLDSPRNQLVLKYIEGIQAMDCKVFVLENVPQLLTVGDGIYLHALKEALPNYEISSGVLNSAWFGSPQKRKRAFVIGSTIGRIELPQPIYDEHEYMTVGEAFQGLHDGLPNQMDYSNPKPLTLERMGHVPMGGNIKDIPAEIRPRGGHSIVYKRLDWNEPAPTIVNVRKANITHPFLNRMLSVRETARLFDLPDTFEFKGRLASMQQQIANAVPVKMVRAIARKVKEAFIKASKQKMTLA
jgi:DNA (cytosine-5)-methyltransferase 1